MLFRLTQGFALPFDVSGLVGWCLRIVLSAAWLSCLQTPAGEQACPGRLLALCYHDVPAAVKDDPYGVDLKSFAEQLEYLRTHGYEFVSVDDVRNALDGRRALPDRAALISFDDGYVSFASNVLPIAELYKCPLMLAICGSWIEEGAPADLPAPLMTWDQIRTLRSHPLVTIASHSYALHKAVQYNPQGNTGPAATSRIYFPDLGRYETAEEQRLRLSRDHMRSRQVFMSRLGFEPDVLVWPYGECNTIAEEEARKAGFRIGFLLRNHASTLADPLMIDRWVLFGNPPIRDFIEDLRVREKAGEFPMEPIRGFRLELDDLAGGTAVVTDRNLDVFIERVARIRPNAVVLRVTSDSDGDGAADAAFFPNSILPVKEDIANRVANQLLIRGYDVYIEFPGLAVELPDETINARLAVREYTCIGPRISREPPMRLSPFSSEASAILGRLASDLAAHVRFHGLIVGRDAFLTSLEDMHPDALAESRKYLGFSTASPPSLEPKHAKQWYAWKARRIDEVLRAVSAEVRKYRPDVRVARALDRMCVERPAEALMLFSQDIENTLREFDMAAVDIGAAGGFNWAEKRRLKSLARLCRDSMPAGKDVMFLVGCGDGDSGKRISAECLLERTRALVAGGATHVLYYPDKPALDIPRAESVRMEYGTEIFLYPRPAGVKRGY